MTESNSWGGGLTHRQLVAAGGGGGGGGGHEQATTFLLPLTGTNGSLLLPDASRFNVSGSRGAGTGSIVTGDGKWGGSCLQFNGGNTFFTFPLTRGQSDLGRCDFTMEGWVKPTGGGGNPQVFASISTSSDFSYRFLVQGGFLLFTYMRRAAGGNSSGSEFNLQSATAAIIDDVWNHVALCCLDGVLSLYCGISGSGNRVATATRPAPVYVLDNPSLNLGRQESANTFYVNNGFRMNDFRICMNKALYAGATYTLPPAAFTPFS